jgi:hypothetical protein
MCTFIRDDGLLRMHFLPHPLTSVLPLLHRTVSGIAISPIGGMFCLFFIVLYQVLLYHD